MRARIQLLVAVVAAAGCALGAVTDAGGGGLFDSAPGMPPGACAPSFDVPVQAPCSARTTAPSLS